MMLERMTASEWREAQEYYSIEPYGEYREELRNGTLCSLTANINRDSKSCPEPYTALDFMHFTERPKEPEAPVEDPEVLSTRIASEVFRF